MAKFVFRLENILQIKYKLEEQSKIEFGNAMERLNNALHKLDILSLISVHFLTPLFSQFAFIVS